MTTTTSTAAPEAASRPPARLLLAGLVAGPLYMVVALAQAVTRDGFDVTRHPFSLLSNGDLGWIQIANFVVTGLLVWVFATGVHRALKPGFGATWAPRLIAVYGIGLIGAGVFVADPADGFPIGTPAGYPESMSWHGIAHFIVGAPAFVALIAATFILARRFFRDHDTVWATFSALTGVTFAVGFAAISSGTGASWTIVAFLSAVVVSWVWMAALALRLGHAGRGR